MEWTGLNELREKFLSFYESKGHLRLPSFSLIPQGDKSLLLINAGMSPMKKYFTGEITPPRTRVTTCQKCIRTPDIENVGKTARHGTYFEMLGNFSFGDYFKHDAITWAWEFCTKVIEMDPERLYISVYLDDDEAYDIWTKEIGVQESHMVRFGKEDNFWEHGAGPCGPCSEIYYDRGPEHGCGKPDCKVGCECDRYVEFWNLVFTQFENDGHNHYTPLAHPNIDTGMGLERLACIAQNVDNLFEVDTIQNIMKHIAKIAGVEYHTDEKSDVSLRVITDHIRSTTFMIGDGVMPSNSGRGYVLRRLLRRAARHGRLLGINRPFLAEVADTVINENKNAYPNLVEKRDFIVNVISTEEESFNRTIDAGLDVLSKMIEDSKSKELSAEDAFKLQDTFGFPIDLTKEILEEKGMTVDEDKFKELVLVQRKRSRDAHKGAGAEGWNDTGVVTKGIAKTEFKGYDSYEAEGKIIAFITDGIRCDVLENGADSFLVADKTSFYAESGGQVGDTGYIYGDGFTFEVENTTKTNDGVILHYGRIIDGDNAKTGDSIKTAIDSQRRDAIARNHTAAHLLQAALRKTLGSHVEQAGQLVNENTVRFDFSHFSAMTSDELKTVENEVNNIILSAESVTMTEMPIEEAKKTGAMALFGEKYGDVVRVVKAGDFSTELCGGTHVSNTGKLGLFKIITETSVAAGVRRIEAVTGTGVLNYIDSLNSKIFGTAAALKVSNPSDIEKKAVSLSNELKEKDREIEALTAQLTEMRSGSLFDNAVEVGTLKVIAANAGEVTVDELRQLSDKAKAEGDNIVAVFGAVNKEKGSANFAACCSPEAVKSGVKAGDVVRAVAKLAGGNGGGKPDFAMAGAKDIDKVDEAIAAVADIVKSFIK
ncbi:MAG: alanine--tRNA ligase [Ruminococcaceae bacterium]|nr:alanine--tRNA ligase [Oscillospiraceae bacterium]